MLYTPNGLMPNGYASTGAGPAPPKLARRLVPSPGPTYPHGIMTPSERAVMPLRAAFSHWNAVGSDLPKNAQYAAASYQLTFVTGYRPSAGG